MTAPKLVFYLVRIYEQSRAIAVVNIPANISTELLWMIFESPRYDGGKIDTIDCEDGRAIITFRDSSGE